MDPLREYFQGRRDVVVAYRFGSSSRGGHGWKLRPDLDLAVLLDTAEDVLRVKTRTEADLQRLLNRPDVEVAVLNDAPPLLCYEVIRCRQVLYERTVRDRVLFESRTLGLYYDSEPLRRFLQDELRQRLEDGTFGRRERHHPGTRPER